MKIHIFLKLIVVIAISELAGFIGSYFTTSSVTNWYETLAKPLLNPPSWVFAPVWATLFVLMGIAAFLVLQKGFSRKDVKVALGIFIFQLILNTFWSIIFFGWHNVEDAFIDLLFLFIFILITIILFRKISKPTLWLLLPYILWVTFAGYLNYSIWQISKIPTDNTPISLSTKYIHAVDWPPKIQISNGPFTCLKNQEQTINNHTYCIIKDSEGAAGSIYTTYTYTLPENNQTLTLSFTLRSVQCLNYDDPQKTECLNERQSFNVDDFADKIIQQKLLHP